MSSLLDAFGLALVFAMAALLAVAYYRSLPSETALRARLPNTPSAAGVIGFLLVSGVAWYLIASSHGLARVQNIIGILFDLLIFETVLLFVFRWLRSNLLSLLLALATAAIAWYVQHALGSVVVYNITFILATFGATALLTRMRFLRPRLLMLVAALWTIYDVLSSLFIYPIIYRPAQHPVTSFAFPAVAVGQLTLGSGDFMFLTLFTLILFRDYGWRPTWVHISVQAAVLFLVAGLKPTTISIPYLLVMTPIFFLVHWWFALLAQTNPNK